MRSIRVDEDNISLFDNTGNVCFVGIYKHCLTFTTNHVYLQVLEIPCVEYLKHIFTYLGLPLTDIELEDLHHWLKRHSTFYKSYFAKKSYVH